MIRIAFLMILCCALALPSAAADTFVCQPVPSALVCAYVWTQPTLAGAASCVYGGVVSACAGGGHEEGPGDIRNSAGGGACLGTTTCIGGQAGQYAIGPLFIVGFAGGVAAPQGSVVLGAYAGANNGAPYRLVNACASTIVTGGTCLLV